MVSFLWLKNVPVRHDYMPLPNVRHEIRWNNVPHSIGARFPLVGVELPQSLLDGDIRANHENGIGEAGVLAVGRLI